MENNIAGKVVVITGASSGLGEATARHLSPLGASVVLGARRADRLRALADELTADGGKALAIPTDVTRFDQVQKLVDAAVQTFGRIDVMINNAGLMPHSPLERLKVAEWDRMIDVNIKGVLYGIAAALPYMKQQKAGHIVNVSSVAGHKVTPAGAVYSATKHAVRALSEGLRQEVKPQHPHYRDLARSGGHGAARQHHRAGRGRENPQVLSGGRDPCRFIRAGRRLRDEPARRGGRKRDPVPAHTPGAVSSGKDPAQKPSKRNTQMEIKRSGSQPSGKGPAEWFTGTVRIDPLVQASPPARTQGISVTFEPGARTAWHTHPLGQTLIVTAGCGLVQRWGGPVEEIRPGDVVWIPPGEKHWHGASPTTAMIHIAIYEELDGRAVEWMEKVNDEQYRAED